jgi:plastocyanin
MLGKRGLRTLQRLAAVLLLAGALTAAFAVGGNPPSPANAQTSTINIDDFVFIPATLTVAPGTTVEWFNVGNAPHTTTSDTGLWNSQTPARSGRFTHQFNQPGTYTYKCTIHPQMTGTITVQGTAAATATTTATTTASPAATTSPGAITAPPPPTATTVAQPGTGQWVDRPPAASGAAASCPTGGQWLLIYWSGSDNSAIATSAAVCNAADLYWVSREGRWLGFSKNAPAASDTWNVLNGEAHFVHGQQ